MARGANEARVIERLGRLAPQQKTLELAVGQFSDEDGQFGKTLWSEGFDSREPEDILKVKGVTSLFEGLVNHLVEMFRFGSRLAGIEISRRDPNKPEPTVREVLDAVAADGGLTASQAKRSGVSTGCATSSSTRLRESKPARSTTPSRPCARP